MTDNLPVPIPALPQGAWAPLDSAPKDKPLILFCPWVDSPDGTGGHEEAKVAHGRVVGWWSEKLGGWAAALPGSDEVQVYPSRWATLLGEPG